MQKQTGFYETQLKKHVKTASQKLYFKLNFVVGLQYKTQFGLLPNILPCLLHRKRKSRCKRNTTLNKNNIILFYKIKIRDQLGMTQ
jgi:hypothetical protein